MRIISKGAAFVLVPGEDGTNISQNEPREVKNAHFRKFMPKELLFMTRNGVVNHRDNKMIGRLSGDNQVQSQRGYLTDNGVPKDKTLTELC